MKTLISLLMMLTISISLMAQSSVDLKYNLKINETYHVKTTSIQDMVMTMQGNQQAMEVKNVMYLSLKPLKNENEYFLAEVKFDTIINDISGPASMMLSSADEGDISSQNPADVMSCVLNRLSKSTILIKLTNKGKVIDILNLQVISDNVLAGTENLQGTLEPLKAQLSMMVEKDAIISMIEAVTSYMPGTKIKKGEKWNIVNILSSGGIGMEITTDYILNDITKTEADISGEVIIEPNTDKPTIVSGMEVTNKVRGIGKTTMKINSQNGWIIYGSSQMQLSGERIIKMQGNEMQIPIEIKGSTEITAL